MVTHKIICSFECPKTTTVSVDTVSQRNYVFSEIVFQLCTLSQPSHFIIQPGILQLFGGFKFDDFSAKNMSTAHLLF